VFVEHMVSAEAKVVSKGCVKRGWSPGRDAADHGVRGGRLSKSRNEAGIGSMPKERRKAPRRGIAFLAGADWATARYSTSLYYYLHP
jgi:hypothetical protein